jgi:aminopeptidase N
MKTKVFLRAARLVLTTGLALAFTAGAIAKTEPKAEHAERIVLPSSVTPDHYRIAIVPDIKGLTFAGTVEIDVTVHELTDTIVLNSADIVIDSAVLSSESATPKVSYDEKIETASFGFGHQLKPGAYTLKLAYHGKIYQQASGLFALDYEAANGKQRALFTQFENSDARRFVPSWDEPARKATFELTATIPADQMPISNMPVASTEALSGGLQRVHFAPSPKMSSYLLFFGCGDFERVHREVSGVDIGVVVKRGDTAHAAFALDAAAQILPYYNDYFGTPYPLPKMDLIAGPGSSQFFGAMENWGAIFYFERDLLVDARSSTEHDKQNVYIVIAHEMAHQWFGDLVTMAWWDDLWLNEGFAEWMMNKVTDRFHPEWKVWLQDLGREKQNAMNLDARDGTHPIITPINDVQQAAGAFDDITYDKGAAVIRTVETYVGEDAFRAGVRRYMHDHAYGNTVTDELWKEIDRGSKQPITQIAHDFTLQAGVPLINEISSKCGGGVTTVTLTQGHFAIDPDSTKARVWQVPVIATDIGGKPARAVVSGPAQKSMKLAGCGTVIVNAGQTAYFRTHYSKASFEDIAEHYAELSSEDQLGVFVDTSSLAYNGLTPMSDVLDLASNIPPKADPVVISAITNRLRGIDRVYDGLPGQAAFRDFARGALSPVLARIGWDKKAGEADNVALLRADLIATLSDMDDRETIGEAKRRFKRYVADNDSLDAGTRRSVLGVIATHADAASWEKLHEMAKTAKSQLDREEFYHLLGAPRNKALAQKALELSLTDEPPVTLAPGIISAVANYYPELAFDFATSHWDQVGKMIEPTTQSRYVPRLINSASDAGLATKLDAFAKNNIPESAMQDVRKADALVRYVAKVRNERLPEVDKWLKGQHG